MVAHVPQFTGNTAQGDYSRYFDGAASMADKTVSHIDLDAIPPEDRAKVVPLLIEFKAIQAEKRRRGVRFLPAQVIRRIKLGFQPASDSTGPASSD